MGNTWARWGSIPVVFSPGMAGHLRLILHATVTSLSLKENRRVLERDDLGPPFVPGGQEIGDGVGIPKPRESGSVIGADRRRSGPSCVLPKGVPRPNGE